MQVDLGQLYKIQQVKVFPVLANFSVDAQNFPRRFRIETSDDPLFTSSRTIADHTNADYPSPGDKVAIFPGNDVAGQFVRLTATLLSGNQLALSKLEVWSAGRDVAQDCRITDVDSMEIFNAAAGGDITPEGPARGIGPDQSEYQILQALYPTMPASGPYLGLVAWRMIRIIFLSLCSGINWRQNIFDQISRFPINFSHEWFTDVTFKAFWLNAKFLPGMVPVWKPLRMMLSTLCPQQMVLTSPHAGERSHT